MFTIIIAISIIIVLFLFEKKKEWFTGIKELYGDSKELFFTLLK